MSGFFILEKFKYYFCCTIKKKFMKNIFLGLISIFAFISVNAQSKISQGFVIDSITLSYIHGVRIDNLNNKYKARTNQYGRFGIQASVGDRLQFSAPGYEPFILDYSTFYYEQDTMRIILKPVVTTMEDVVVSTYSYVDYQRDSVDRRQEFVAANGTLKKTFDNNNSGVGMGISIDNLFSRREKRKKKAYRLFEEMEQQEYIRFRYNPVLVHSLTGLEGEALSNFIFKTQPDYNWLRKHTTREDMLYYINEQMKKMKN